LHHSALSSAIRLNAEGFLIVTRWRLVEISAAFSQALRIRLAV
jgi:hypothetical protein